MPTKILLIPLLYYLVSWSSVFPDFPEQGDVRGVVLFSRFSRDIGSFKTSPEDNINIFPALIFLFSFECFVFYDLLNFLYSTSVGSLKLRMKMRITVFQGFFCYNFLSVVFMVSGQTCTVFFVGEAFLSVTIPKFSFRLVAEGNAEQADCWEASFGLAKKKTSLNGLSLSALLFFCCLREGGFCRVLFLTIP